MDYLEKLEQARRERVAREAGQVEHIGPDNADVYRTKLERNIANNPERRGEQAELDAVLDELTGQTAPATPPEVKPKRPRKARNA